jgi:hypothetical protein
MIRVRIARGEAALRPIETAEKSDAAYPHRRCQMQGTGVMSNEYRRLTHSRGAFPRI